MIKVRKLFFSYFVGNRKIEILKNLNFSVKRGEFVGIQGPSGSGKSTLFYILGLLLRPTQGDVFVGGLNISELSADDLTLIRNQRIGFIFQQFHLLSNSSCLKNILLPSLYPIELFRKNLETENRAKNLANQLGLSQHLSHFPNQLSGGQQQRVAIARALINDVDLILADEPTGNLDSKTATEIMELLQSLNRMGKTIVLITHDKEVARYCSKVYYLRDGSFIDEVENQVRADELEPSQNHLPSDLKPTFLPPRLSFRVYYKIFRSTFPLVVENLIRNKTKSILTMLGVVIGVAAVLAMITLGQFSKNKILETYEALGINKLVVRGYPNWNLRATDKNPVRFQSFNIDQDIFSLHKVFHEIKLISPVFRIGQNNATANGLRIENQIETYGVSPEYLWITHRSLLAGTNISPFHIESASPVCLIGFGIAERLFARTGAIGQMVNVTDMFRLNFNCRVIGVLESQTSTRDNSPPNLHILIPFTFFQTIAPNWWYSRSYEAAIQIASNGDVEMSGRKIKAFFEQKYGSSGTFWVDTDSALVSQMKKFLGIFTVLLSAIAFLSLLVGGIGINNMILVSVTERIKEFGIRKALGATNRSIRFQVLLESLSICGVAGVLGIGLGVFAYEMLIYGASQFVPGLQFEWVFIPSAILISLCSIVLVGIFSGLIPAIRAERLQIIEALRAE